MIGNKSAVVKVLMNRDGLTESGANEEYDSVMEEVLELIESGDFEDAEETFCSSFGLELDYLI
jgi:hypothetical protein